VGELSDRLKAIEVEVRSADRRITARLSGEGRQVEVLLAPGAYRRYRMPSWPGNSAI
jgi:hypothetical protein